MSRDRWQRLLAAALRAASASKYRENESAPLIRLIFAVLRC